jgi:inner membrane protein
MSAFVLFWLILGIVLVAAEFAVPGLVVVFLGLGALVVAALGAAGIVSTPLAAGGIWAGVSLGLTLTLRGAAVKFLPSESSRKEVDEDLESEDTIVDVLVAITSENSEGRIRSGGTTWAARALDEPIAAGSKARLMYREGLVWVVSPVLFLAEKELE